METNGHYYIAIANHFGPHDVVEEVIIESCGKSNNGRGSWEPTSSQHHQLKPDDRIKVLGVDNMFARMELPDGQYVKLHRKEIFKILAKKPTSTNGKH